MQNPSNALLGNTFMVAHDRKAACLPQVCFLLTHHLNHQLAVKRMVLKKVWKTRKETGSTPESSVNMGLCRSFERNLKSPLVRAPIMFAR